ncbi:SDR family oxidoreductase [Elongatibacter sediminis]|uniref:SDR family oxidoreductase n=1 Tax=Elongatibacter sediminis TaxID=3119006 RepID=A0AAW9RGD2_9GAMM
MILLSGATGKTGRHVVDRIIADELPARAWVRNPAAADALRAAGLDVVVGDLGDETLLAGAMDGVTRALLLAANTPAQLEQERRFIAAAESAGVEHVVKMSAIGADAGADAVLKSFHGQSEDRLRGASMAHTIVQPNFFMDNLLNVASTIAGQGRFALPMGAGRVGPIDVRDVAEALFISLTRPGHENRTYLISGPDLLSFADMAGVFSEVLGRPVTYVEQPPAEFREQMIGLGLPAWNVDAMLELFALIAQDRNARVTTEFREITGREPRDLARFIRDHAAAFESA